MKPRPHHGLKPEAAQVLPLTGLPCIFSGPFPPGDKGLLASEFIPWLQRTISDPHLAGLRLKALLDPIQNWLDRVDPAPLRRPAKQKNWTDPQT